jgi:hypothetical protein
MMPQLPSEIDYGSRPSLEVNRLDRPTDASVLLADSVVQATETFQRAYDENEKKENALNYALARNELQQLDIEERAKLAEDIDWATHDKRYSEGFTTGKQAITDKYGLPERDLALFDSESNLIAANGRVQIAGRARQLEVKEAVGRYATGKAKAKANIILADDGARNGIILGQLDVIDEMERAGFLDPLEAVNEREEVTQDFAMASLAAMDPGPRYRVIAASLRYRKGYGLELGEYADSFTKAADRTGLPVELLHAVASRESSLDPSQVNVDSGAAGIMQLMEITAEEMGVTDRMDADQSIQGGADYLAKMFDKFGDAEAALAAYNWGPRNVKEAQEEFGDDWLSHAPEETRKYVAELVDAWTSGGEVKTDGVFATGSGALTPEDIRNGLGTDSVADFLHADTAAKMMELAGKEDKANRQRAESQDVVNAAWKRFPEDHAKRMQWIADNSDGSVQNLAEEDARQRNNDEKGAKAEASTEKYEGYSQQMEAGEIRFKDIPTEELTDMESRHIDALRIRSRNLSYDEQWPAVTQRTIPAEGEAYGMSLQEWNEISDYGPGGKTDQNLDTAEYYNAFTEKDWNSLKREQDNLRALESSRITTGASQPKAMVDRALQKIGLKIKDDKGNDKLNGIRARMETELRQRILDEQNSTKPPKQLDEEAKNKILADMLKPYAFHDTDFIFTDYDMDEAVPVWLMTTEQREDAYINLEKANNNPAYSMKNERGVTVNLEAILRKIGTDASPRILNPSAHNLERAAFAFVNDIGDGTADTLVEVTRRLRGE